MDIQKFIEKLSSLSENLGQNNINSLSKEFEVILTDIKGKTTPNIMQLLNWAVEFLKDEEIYCEIGCETGINLIGSLLNNQDKIAYVVEDLSDEQFNQLTENLTKFNLDEQVFFCNQNVEEFFADLKELQPDLKIGVYFYNGNSDYRSVLMGLLLVRPFLADQALIIINNSNYTMVSQANYDFINSNKSCNLLLELPVNFDDGITILTWNINQKINYNWQEIENKYRNILAIEAISNLHFDLEFQQKPQIINNLTTEALELNNQEKLDQAIEKYQEALIIDKNNPSIYNNLALIYFKQGNYQEALECAKIAVNLDSSLILHHLNLGKILEKLEKIRQTNPNFNQLINLTQEKIIAFLSLGDFLIRENKYTQAIEIYKQALILKQKEPIILAKMAKAFELNNNRDQALLFNAYLDHSQEKYKEALVKFEEFFIPNIGNGFDYAVLADCYQNIGKEAKARITYIKGLEKYPDHEYLYLYFILFLQKFGYTEKELDLLNQYLEKMPNNLTGQLEVKRLLPIIYNTKKEIIFYNNKFQEFLNYLDDLRESQILNNPQNLNYALQSIEAKTNFYLIYQYQSEIYKEQQKQYGDFVHYVMKLKYPQYIKPLTMPSLTNQGKIKIGYLSDQIGNSSATKWIIGWLENCDRNQFEIYIYATSKRIVMGEKTDQIKELSDYFYYIPDDIDAISIQILKDKLHILVFLAIGMWAATTQLASLRLAPIQCTTWGHPSTSGLPTIDYYLSGDLIESENAQEYYTEKLIRLPNLGISYPKPNISKPITTRSNFNLSEDKIVYLSCQAIFKYLPQYDYIFPEIALKVPKAQFLFILRKSDSLKELSPIDKVFYHRLQKAFSAVNLNLNDYCIFLLNQNWESYTNLLFCVDIFLDTFAFSGGHTTFDALTCNLPIVTCPGKLMLGRQSYGILKMLKVEEMIANNEQEYIDIAVKLGLDQDWRNSIKKKIEINLDRIYNDLECVKGLEQFYQKVVQEYENN